MIRNRTVIGLMLFLRILGTLFGLAIIAGVLGGAGALWVFNHYGKDLPDYRQLADYEPPVMTRVHAGDGRLLAEYATEKRVFVPIKAMPRLVVRAFLSAEDKTFYSHPGIDITGVLNAVLINLKNFGGKRRPVGASTITQQVAKNFLLTNEISIERKIKEAILALRIERAFPKDRILELYLNEIYLGQGSYGGGRRPQLLQQIPRRPVGGGGRLFGGPAESAEQLPSDLQTKAAVTRRDWVVGRMLDDGVITAEQAKEAKNVPLIVRDRDPTEYVEADFFAEEVRRELAEHYGESRLYKGGLSVQTTLNPIFQNIARRALREGLEAYDRRHGWRGPVARLLDKKTGQVPIDWPTRLANTEPPAGAGAWKLALVLSLDTKGVDIAFRNAAHGRIPLEAMEWARSWREGEKLGPRVGRPSDVLSPGDLVLVEPHERRILDDRGKETGETELVSGAWALRQIPEINGAVVAMDPHTGRVLAMVGGYDFQRSKFNRAVQEAAAGIGLQALRLSGGARPRLYAFDVDFGRSFRNRPGTGLPKWRPANYTRKFYGPGTMRLGIEKSQLDDRPFGADGGNG